MAFIYDIRELSLELQQRVNQFFSKLSIAEINGGDIVPAISLKLDGGKKETLVRLEDNQNRADVLMYQIDAKYPSTLHLSHYEEVVAQIFTDFLIAHSLWQAGNVKAGNLIRELFPWYASRLAEVERATNTSFYFYETVIYPVIASVQEMMINTVGIYQSWDMWTVTQVGRTLVIERGIDYRIWDWERRNAAGEFS